MDKTSELIIDAKYKKFIKEFEDNVFMKDGKEILNFSTSKIRDLIDIMKDGREYFYRAGRRRARTDIRNILGL